MISDLRGPFLSKNDKDQAIVIFKKIQAHSLSENYVLIMYLLV